jgi:hypothetical protein
MPNMELGGVQPAAATNTFLAKDGGGQQAMINVEFNSSITTKNY